MDATNTLILLGAALVFASILASLVSARLGLPLLLIFLAVGMLAGEDGPGGIVFNNFELAMLVGHLALAVILLDGGLRTQMRTFRVALQPAVTLATFGVVATAAAVGWFSWWLLELDWRLALLLGAIVGSTDAAAVFSLLRNSGARLNERVEATLEIESGSNDPMAIFLVIMLVEWLAAGQGPGSAMLVWAFLLQLGLGALGGVLGGWILAELLARMRLVEGLYALFVVSGGLALFALINLLGGSGFLAVYLAGLVIGNRRTDATEHVLRVMDGLAWLSQAGMFLVLGLLVKPSMVLDDLLSAIVVALFLILVARPLAVGLGLAPFRFPLREIGFISWVGLRGAVPIVLAVFPMIAGLPQAQLLFNVTFAVVLVSLMVQGTTVPVAARLFRVQVPSLGEPRDRQLLDLPVAEPLELVQFEVQPGTLAEGRTLAEILDASFPPAGRVIGVIRDGALQTLDDRQPFQADDLALLLLPVNTHDQVAQCFARLPDQGPLAAQAFFGEFVLSAEAPVGDVAALYGLQVAEADSSRSLADFVMQRQGKRVVVGDRILLGRSRITVREVEDGRPVRVGLKLLE